MKICAACQEEPQVLTKKRFDTVFWYVGWTCGAWMDRASHFDTQIEAEKFLADHNSYYNR